MVGLHFVNLNFCVDKFKDSYFKLKPQKVDRFEQLYFFFSVL